MSQIVYNNNDQHAKEIKFLSLELCCSSIIKSAVRLFSGKHIFYLGLGPFEPSRDKTNKVSVRPAKTQISLGIAQSDQNLRCALNG